MKNHIQIHIPGQEMLCPICAKVYKNKPALNEHMRSCKRAMSVLKDGEAVTQ